MLLIYFYGRPCRYSECSSDNTTGIVPHFFCNAENRDLPSWFAKLHPVRATPYNAILVFGLIMTIFAAFTDLTRAIAISNFASLLYYAIANYAASKAGKNHVSSYNPVIGLITCVFVPAFPHTGCMDNRQYSYFIWHDILLYH